MKLTIEQVKRLIQYLPDDLEVVLKLPVGLFEDIKSNPPVTNNPSINTNNWRLVDTQWPPVNLNNSVPASKFPTTGH